jgi:hypothetical protein
LESCKQSSWGVLARSLDVQLTQAESLRSIRERPDNPDATDLAMRGWAALNRPSSPAHLEEVAPHETGLSAAKRLVLSKLFAGHHPSYPAGQKIIVKANKIVCRQSNVAISQRSCALTFGSHNVNLTGRPSHEIFATLIEAGVPSDGAAGSVFETLTALTCTIDPNEIGQNTGGGASCTFTPGP